jgi:2-desacetyl-2-hydroxyethyl bacteriochlorophyllide A dehydrogenase
MKALVYSGTHSVCYHEVKLPVPREDDVAVDVLQAGICGTDMCAVRDGRPAVEPLMTLGHEFVGRRQDTGELVVGNPLLSCGQCRACKRGWSHLCVHRVVLGVHRPGAFTHTVQVPASRLVPMRGVTLEQAALVDPVATALHAFRLAPRPEGPVAVLGAGAIGLSMLFVLKSQGINDVTMTDIAQQRLDFALAGGADAVASRAEGSYDVVYDTVGSVATRQDAVLRCISGGDAVLVGLHSAELNVPAGPVIGGERTIRGSFGYTDDEFREAAALVPRISTDWVHTVGFGDAEFAFQSLLAGRSDPRHVKVQMRMDH